MFNIMFKMLRQKNKYTQSEIAEKLKISQRAVAYYEKGDRLPDFEMLIKIAKIFDVSTDYLLGIDKNVDTIEIEDFSLVIKKAKEQNITPKDLEEIILFISKQKNNKD